MAVVRHTAPPGLLAAAEPLLARNPAVRAFVTAWAQGWRNAARHPGPPTYVATCRIGAAHGLALMREGPLSLENSDPPAVAAIADDLARDGRRVTNVVGEHAACTAFADAWRAHHGLAHVVAMQLRHHMLTRLAPAPVVPGRMRHAVDEDLAWLLEGSLAFAREARLPDPPEHVRTVVMRRHAERRFRIWDDGVPVAFAASIDAGRHEGRIGLVYTLPQARRRGYAGALVSAVVAQELQSGKARLFLTTDVANPTSNALYARLGFHPVSDAFRFDFVPATPSAS
jgi:predicted GNAT family acetyltransferase